MKNLKTIFIIAFSIMSNLSHAQNTNKESVMIVIEVHDAEVLITPPFTIYVVDNLGNYSMTEFNKKRNSRNDNVLVETKNVIDIWIKNGFKIETFEVVSITPGVGFRISRTVIIMTN